MTNSQVTFAAGLILHYIFTFYILYLYDMYVLSVDGWSRTSHPCTRNEFGVWELTIPYKEDGSSPIPHGSKVKVSVDK